MTTTVYLHSYLIRVSNNSLIIATTSSSSSDGAEKKNDKSLALTKTCQRISLLKTLFPVELVEIPTRVWAWHALLIYNRNTRGKKVHYSGKDVGLYHFPFHI